MKLLSQFRNNPATRRLILWALGALLVLALLLSSALRLPDFLRSISLAPDETAEAGCGACGRGSHRARDCRLFRAISPYC